MQGLYARGRNWRLAALLALGVAGWMFFAFAAWFTITKGPQLTSGNIDHVDWHVYLAGARDLVNGVLYRVPLALDGRSLSSPVFNLPPMSAAIAVPFLGVPVDTGAAIWQVIAAASLAISISILMAICGVTHRWAWAGIVATPLVLMAPVLEGLDIGTDNYLMLALVALFAWAYLNGHDTLSAGALALAIALKIWPAFLLVMVIRDRRWQVAWWVGGLVVAQALVFVAWLGPGVVPRAIEASRVSIPAIGTVLGPSGWPPLRGVWTSGIDLVAAALLVVLPLRGRAAIGAGILAGLAIIINLWGSYLPTVLFALSLLAAAAFDALRGRYLARRPAVPS